MIIRCSRDLLHGWCKVYLCSREITVIRQIVSECIISFWRLRMLGPFSSIEKISKIEYNAQWSYFNLVNVMGYWVYKTLLRLIFHARKSSFNVLDVLTATTSISIKFLFVVWMFHPIYRNADVLCLCVHHLLMLQFSIM